MIQKAVIVAAGLSSRLYPLTLDKPKGLLEVNGKALLQKSVETLRSQGIKDIAIVVGYRKEQIMEALGPDIHYITNPFYKHCNNMGSLWFARHFINNQPFIYMHGDIIFHRDMFTDTLEAFKTSDYDMELVTDFKNFDEESMKVRVTPERLLIESMKGIPLDEADGEWIGLTYVRSTKKLFEYIEKALFEADLNNYDTFAFTRFAADGYRVHCSSTQDLPWVEIDFLEDYERAKALFA